MWVDIIFIIFILLMTVTGYKNGFFYTSIKVLSWVLSMVLGFLFYDDLAKFLKENTNFYDSLNESILTTLSSKGLSPDTILHGFPSALNKFIEDLNDTLMESLGHTLSNIIFAVCSFLLIVFAVKLVAYLFINLFSKKKRKGLIGGIDGMLGLVSGFILGFLLIFVFLTLVVPFTALSGSTFLLDTIEASVFGKELFNNNLILLIFSNFG